MSTTFRCLIMGAAGRDFHDFQTFFHSRPQFRVVGFTAAQIPFIAARSFPRQLAGPHYEEDIPIFPEEELPQLVSRFGVDFVFLAYSDLSHEEVMHRASLVQACGASFVLLGPNHTQLRSTKPVVAVTAVRTGAGKSPLSQYLARHLTDRGHRVGVVRHPMPYGDLTRQAVERLTSEADLQRFECTVEEREEYEPYIEQGLTVYAGVDYRTILGRAAAESDLILWDGGNNDSPFVEPGFLICVADALRPGHEVTYHPGETNLRRADYVLVNKVSAAEAGSVESIRRHVGDLNPGAQIGEADLEIAVAEPEAIRGRRALVIEDGPTLTHGGMSFGAGTVAARRYGARELVDPRPVAVGSIAAALRDYPHLDRVLPALGYSVEQRRELAATISASGAEVVVDASPARLAPLLSVDLPIVRARYRFRQTKGIPVAQAVDQFLAEQG